MKFRQAKKILRGLHREIIPYTEAQIEAAHRRIARACSYPSRAYWYTESPKGDIPLLYSPVRQRSIEHILAAMGWYDNENQ